VRAVSIFSGLIALALTATAPAQGAADLAERMRQASPEQVERLLSESEISGHPAVEDALEGLRKARTPAAREEAAIIAREVVELRAAAERTIDDPAAIDLAREVKASPVYLEPDQRAGANWLAEALRRLRNIRSPFRAPDAPNLPRIGLAGWLVPVMWVLLGLAAAFFAYLAFRHFRWKIGLSRRTKAMLEEDEPERTVDEWLELADQLEAEGRLREAVRCLYLACLIRFDEARVARFDRGQTNWEHLARIQASDRLPSGLDFSEPTKRFDRIWYGWHVRGPEDVADFRGWYTLVNERLREAA
jgi:hypothetical protein